MKTIVHINSMINGSTGRIMNGLSIVMREKKWNVYTFTDGHRFQREINIKDSRNHFFIGSSIESTLHKKMGYYTGKSGTYSKRATMEMVAKLKKIQPDIVHLHNLHESYINYEILFKYLKDNNIKVVWTLHDCWAFTGHCPHFIVTGCDKWKRKCCNCPSYGEYPQSRIDNSEFLFQLKKKIFTCLDDKNVKIITPSKYIEKMAKQSFLGKYSISTIYNGIDTNIFNINVNGFKAKNGIENKIMVLGVAAVWNEKKGLSTFIRLSKELPDNYQIVMVGIDRRKFEDFPENIITIKRTESVEELVEIYSEADIFLNPTREEALGLTTIEALSCGTAVILYDAGGSKEAMLDADGNVCGGTIVQYKDDRDIAQIVLNFDLDKYDKNQCRKQALRFDKKEKYIEYAKVYESLINKG